MGGGGRAGFKRYIWISCWSTKNVLLSQQLLTEIVVLDLYPPVYGLLLALDGVKPEKHPRYFGYSTPAINFFEDNIFFSFSK